jgi:hypothetical protein
MRIEAESLPASMMPRLEKLLFRLMRDATKLGIGLTSVSLTVRELDNPKSKGGRGNNVRYV